MAYCDLCEMNRDYCEHGLQDRRAVMAAADELLISPNGMGHFPGCPHKGDDRTTADGPSLIYPVPGNG